MISKSYFFELAIYGAAIVFVIICGSVISNSQVIGLITPEPNSLSESFSAKLESALSKNHRILDRSLSAAAFQKDLYENPFNLTLAEARVIGSASGAGYILLIKSDTIRRYSFEKKEFFESFAVVYVISSRTGRMVYWNLVKGESAERPTAENLLLVAADKLAAESSQSIVRSESAELVKDIPQLADELPDENSDEGKTFRPPLPYKRISPKYTDTASLYGIEATVDILIDIDAAGSIQNSQILRWAGFGLDESVVAAVNEMNWRPADQNGKPRPMRILLRYNFKKLDKE